MQHEDLAGLVVGAVSLPVTPMFITPSEMIDVAETELFADRKSAVDAALPTGENAHVTQSEAATIPAELNAWLSRLSSFAASVDAPTDAHQTLLPAGFAVASYRASLLPLLGDESEAALQGGTATMARLPLEFTPRDGMVKLKDPQVAAISHGTLAPKTDKQPDTEE
jgi:hypothetical protein